MDHPPSAGSPSHPATTPQNKIVDVVPERILPPPVSDSEAKLYYYGLPSKPILVARTGTTPWHPPLEGELPKISKGLHPAGRGMAQLQEAFGEGLFDKVADIMKSMDVQWTSVDIVRIGDRDVQEVLPNVVWIGIRPGSLSREDGVVVAFKVLDLLLEHGIHNFDVELRESVVRFL